MTQERLSGVLLHVTSLPSRGGVGDFGPAAYAFVDFLVAAKQQLWQVLPLNPTGYGSSPYCALSAFAGNPMLISLEFLARDGWIAEERLNDLPGIFCTCDLLLRSRHMYLTGARVDHSASGHEPWGNAIKRDIPGTKLHGKCSGKAHHALLGRGVGGQTHNAITYAKPAL